MNETRNSQWNKSINLIYYSPASKKQNCSIYAHKVTYSGNVDDGHACDPIQIAGNAALKFT